MKYILHYVGAMNRGGMENVIMNFYKNIDRSKYQFHFAVHTEKESDWDETIRKLGGKIISFPNFRDNPIKYKKTWKNFWRENNSKYFAFHYHTNSLANITALKEAVNEGKTGIIVHAHSAYADKGKLQKIHNIFHKKNQKYINRHVPIKVAVSKNAANWLFGSDTDITQLNNGVDYFAHKFNEKKRNICRKKLNVENNLVIGHVGNFYPVKNHKFLINIFREILKIRPESKLLLLGGGALEKDIIDLIKNMDLTKKVIVIGNVVNVNDYLNAMDIFISPSLFEGLGLALIEAQVNGLPSVYSDTIPNEVNISDYTCPMSLDENETAWARESITLFNEFLREENKVNSRKYDVKLTTLKLQKIYSQLEA